MLDIRTILAPECTRAHVEAQSRKRVLEIAAEIIAARHEGLSARVLFDELMSRERLGSTGLGEGVAVPHCRIACPRMLSAFIRLDHPVDYDAIDDRPVDMLFVLVVPTAETAAHLEVLAALARLFSEEDNRRRLRAQPTDAALYAELTTMLERQGD